MFLPFAVVHLMPAFVVLVVGNILSSVVFTVEMIRGSGNIKKFKKYEETEMNTICQDNAHTQTTTANDSQQHTNV